MLAHLPLLFHLSYRGVSLCSCAVSPSYSDFSNTFLNGSSLHAILLNNLWYKKGRINVTQYIYSSPQWLKPGYSRIIRLSSRISTVFNEYIVEYIEQ